MSKSGSLLLSEGQQPIISNIATDTVSLVGGGGTSDPLQDAVGNTDAVLGHTDEFVQNVAQDLSANGGPFNQPLDTTANSVTQDVHVFLEEVAHNVGIANTVHGVTTLGNTAGLSNLGGENLVTDLIESPSDLPTHSNNPTQVLNGIGSDLGSTLNVAPGPIDGVVMDSVAALNGGGLLGGGPNPGGGLPGGSLSGDVLHFADLGGAGHDAMLGAVLPGGSQAGGGGDGGAAGLPQSSIVDEVSHVLPIDFADVHHGF